jgi:asparagine synthase (glutamine-hydrolysing)
MGAEMSHREWYVVETFADEALGVGLGRIGIGIFNQKQQPVWNESGTAALVMAGEFYNQDELGADLGAMDEQVALALYETLGDDFASRLKGAFIVAIWDKTRSRLVIANDRFGTYPLFYAHRAGRLVFAPEMKGVLCDDSFPRKLDLTALAQYMRFQHVLGTRTFFEGIRLLPGGSRLVYELGTGLCRVRSYWTFDDIPHRPDVSFDDAVEETGRLLRLAVRRLSQDKHRPGVYLSGGLDSRTILGMVDRRPIVSLTYGTRDCRDVYYAARIAKALGSDHHWVDLPDGEWVKKYVDFHMELTEGYHSWIHAHGISTLSQARQLMDVNLTGWDGGTVMGHGDSTEPLQSRAVDDAAFTTRTFFMFVQNFTWPSVSEAEENLLYCEPIRRQVQGLAFDSFREELSPYFGRRSDVRGEYFYIRHHCGRLTQNLVTFARSHIEVRFPFFDYDLFDFLYSLPVQLRGSQRLYRAVIHQETPQLAYIPYDQDEFLPTTQPVVRGAHAIVVKLARRLNRYLRSASADRHTLYADYEGYLRGELREWASEILFDTRTLQRGIFSPDFIESIWKRHQSGMEEWTIGKIAPIITYEMMLRRFYD